MKAAQIISGEKEANNRYCRYGNLYNKIRAAKNKDPLIRSGSTQCLQIRLGPNLQFSLVSAEFDRFHLYKNFHLL
jgi:hypothetical protein